MDRIKDDLQQMYETMDITDVFDETLERIDNILNIIDGVDETNASECKIAIQKLKRITEEAYN